MAATLGFDELNKPEFDSEAYIKEYFRPMQISEERKEEREEAAHSFLDVLLFILTLIATENAYNALDWDYIERQLRIELENAAREYARADQAMNDYIAEKAEDFIRVTQGKDLSDPYWTSEERATMEAVNEANDIVGYEEWQQAIDDGFEYKIWHTERDTKVRKTHQAVEGKKLPIKDMFEVGNGLMRYPHDWYYNPDECYNCRCALSYSNGNKDSSGDRERRVTYWGERKFSSDRGDIIARRSERYTVNNIYVDEKVKITPTQLRTINKRISDAKRIHGIGDECDIPVVVVETKDLLASYNPFSNVMYVSKEMSVSNYELSLKQNGFAASDNPNSTMVHEFFHWKDADEYKKLFGEIVDKKNYDIYQREKSIKELIKNGVDISDTNAIMKISQYAREKVVRENNYEEAYTEYRTKQLLEKR